MSTHKKARQCALLDFNYFSFELHKFIGNLESSFDELFSNNKFISYGIKENLLELTRASLSSKAKRVRPMLCAWIFRNYYLKENFYKDFAYNQKNKDLIVQNVMRISLSLEILHCASLVIDDIEDGSQERRGEKALFMKFGMPNTLNAGTWMYFLAIQHLPIRLQPLAIKTLYDCHIGQAMDLSNNNIKLFEMLFFGHTKERWGFYEKCAELKTARLLQFSIECLKNIIKIDKRNSLLLKKIFTNYGISFQIFDDLKNLSSEMSGNKSYEDLHFGLRSSLSLAFLDILTPFEKKEAYNAFIDYNFVSYMTSHKKFQKSIEFCSKKAESFLEQSSYMLDEVSIHPDSREYIYYILETPLEHIKSRVRRLKGLSQEIHFELQIL